MTKQHAREAGFSLIEAMAALAVSAAVIGGLGAIAGQWIPRWREGLATLRRSDVAASGLERIADDLAAVAYVRTNAASLGPYFEGDAQGVAFVRAAADRDQPWSLEVVRLGPAPADGKSAFVRTRSPYAPGPQLSGTLRDPVVLVPPPFGLTFAYAGDDGVWRPQWRGQKQLPAKISVTLADASVSPPMVFATVVSPHAQAAPPEPAAEAQSNAEASE
jgi:general secretion pathway protein J